MVPPLVLSERGQGGPRPRARVSVCSLVPAHILLVHALCATKPGRSWAGAWFEGKGAHSHLVLRPTCSLVKQRMSSANSTGLCVPLRGMGAGASGEGPPAAILVTPGARGSRSAAASAPTIVPPPRTMQRGAPCHCPGCLWPPGWTKSHRIVPGIPLGLWLYGHPTARFRFWTLGRLQGEGSPVPPPLEPSVPPRRTLAARLRSVAAVGRCMRSKGHGIRHSRAGHQGQQVTARVLWCQQPVHTPPLSLFGEAACVP